jgi:DNA replication protein DnaC
MLEEKANAICEDCGREFETHVISIMDVARNISDVCPECRGKRREELEKRERERLASEVAERKADWLLNSGIPQRFRTEGFGTFELRNDNLKKIHDLCVEYAEGFPLARGIKYQSLGLFSKGVWGIGKSHLACSIAHRVIDRWVGGGANSPVLYISEPNMFKRIRATFSRAYDDNGESEERVYNRLITVPLLIVDDIGKEEVADPRFVQRAWFSVINGRYDNLLPIVLTANIDPDGIAQHLGGSRGNEATFDRLYEMLGGVFWELTGDSYRRLENAMPNS